MSCRKEELFTLVAGTPAQVRMRVRVCVCVFLSSVSVIKQFWDALYFFFFFAGSVLNRELEDWLKNADETHTPARAIIAPYPYPTFRLGHAKM